ncbi:vitamin B12 ABC transporter permease BtuC [Halosegnis longus]|uniref:Cobalamin import system permease protein BtuC n=1 Tax=Halosegnis longus TaxID=2216012 RepID=A0AAJ4UWB8_9EURY|nr:MULTISPECIES: vitamin B12 ABC transporter permease BtuC [Halobacteriales]RNJ26901.1 cobalamin ABC transporter permease BtuC [Salella cibi]
MRYRGRTASAVSVLVGLLVGVVVVSAGIGPVHIGPVTVAKVFANALAVPAGVRMEATALVAPWHAVEWYAPFGYDVDPLYSTIVLQVRLPRIAAGASVGFALAAAGTVMQGLFRNPMADPSIIGVSSGASVGAVAAIVAPFALPFGLGLRASAFVGALVAAVVVYAIATEGGRTPVATLLLAGVAVQTFLGSVTSYLILRSGDSIEEVTYWLMGHLDASRIEEALITGGITFVLVAVLYLYAEDLNALLLGETDARSVGVEVEWTKRILLAASSIITGAAVAISGVIGFVGLIVPHALRLIVGPDHRILLPTSALAGASFLVAADTLARSGPAELPVGIVTAAVGAPFFLYLLRKREVSEL